LVLFPIRLDDTVMDTEEAWALNSETSATSATKRFDLIKEDLLLRRRVFTQFDGTPRVRNGILNLEPRLNDLLDRILKVQHRPL